MNQSHNEVVHIYDQFKSLLCVYVAIAGMMAISWQLIDLECSQPAKNVYHQKESIK